MKTCRFESNKLFVFIITTLFGLLVAPAYAQFETQYFKALADDAGNNDLFGSAVAVDGHTAIVGVFSDDDNGSDSGAAYLIDTVTGEQLAKLIASDASSNDRFGWSVAISGSTAIVGAKWNDDFGTNSGAAYLFDTTTGVQIAKLLPNDPDSRDEFGYAVAIGGLPGLQVAVVGAFRDNDHGGDSGSVYLFDITTGAQISKITPNDGLAFDWFGHALAVNGSTLIVGADGVDTNGTNSGAVYLYDIFDAFNPVQINKLFATGGASNDFFGSSVAINGNSAFAGAWGDDENGTDAGAVYMFNATTGQQLNKLMASDGASGDKFGRSVCASEASVIIGSEENDDNGSGSGSAYLFDAITSLQSSKLLPNDGDSGDKFGSAVAISETTAIIGATGFDIGASGEPDFISNSGAVYIFTGDIDTDGDGLYDIWELLGIPYFDAAGNEQRYLLPGANPLHQDLYVEVDAMTGISLNNESVMLLQEAFAGSPVVNPDGTQGIVLHIQRDASNDLPFIASWQTDDCWPLDFDTWRNTYFGTFFEQDDPRLLAAKAKAYRYCIAANRAIPKTVGGCGELPGDNFVIYIGGVNNLTVASVFMHEIGHNLNLHHGGGDDINGKPNYPSVMNYVLSYRYLWNSEFWRLDYSREGSESFGILAESSLDESDGIGVADGLYSNYVMPFGVNKDVNGTTVRGIRFTKLNGSPNDYGDTEGTQFQDGETDGIVVQDLNFVAEPPSGILLPSYSSPDEPLEPYNDWANIGLPLSAALGTSGASPRYPEDELTAEAREWIDENFPLPPVDCQADLTGDGSLNFFDISAFLSAFKAEDLVADFDGNGTFNFFDISAFLTAFSAGCP